MNLPILIRDEVWKYLQSTDLRSAKEVQQCIRKVENGQFDFGLRVKKLKGISQRVWEARINQASRLLFTYRSFKSSDGQVQTYRAIESICVEHDDVNHQARVIGRNWEGLEIVEILGNLDLEFDKLDDEKQEKIQAWEVEEIKTQSALTDELLENIKWLILEPEIIESEEGWRNAIESGADLNLRLTPKESELINIYGNVLISGSAGTGKTTVGLYRLARTLQMNPAAMCLYVAYNPILVKESEEQFKRLWGSSYENLPLKPSFLTIRDLCLKITKDFGKNFDRHLVDYPQFYQRYIKKPESREHPPSLIWDEIRSVIKGANLKEQSQAYLLSEKEYESLSKKRSEVIQKKDRRTIYKLAEWYQGYLSREQLADEIDLTRAALQVTKIENYNPYTLVICDEVQDFTEIQLEFLIRLIAKGGQILCAGDINQMISPSGFRWGDLTTRLHAKNQKWTKENLSTNFRSTGKLVSLAVKILNLKFKLLPESQPPEEVRQNITGELARLVEASSDSFKEINLGAADAILVRTEKRKQELNKTLETTLIFTIEESKGLEFDTVYLIDFFENSRSLWTTALNYSEKLKEQEKPELRLEFNLLYVAITRARRLLNICEVERSDLWKRSELLENLIPMSFGEAFSQTQSTSSQDWYERASYYRDARLFVQALECATKSGDEILTQEIGIESLLLNQKYDEAAQLLLKIEKYSEAAEIFEKIKEWVNAAKCWELAGDLSRKHECDLQLIKCITLEKSSSEKVVVLKKYENNLEEKIINKSKIFNNQDIAHSSSLAEKQDKIYIKYDLEREKLKRNKKNLRRERNTELNLHSAEFYYNNAIAKLSLGDKQGAISDYDLAIKLNPGYSGTYNNRGLIKSDLGDKQGAISDYDLAIKLNSNHPEIYNNRGVAKLDLGDKQGAISDYDLAIKLNPCYVEAYTNRGYVKYLLGDNQGAICDCKQAIRINPNHANAYNNLGLAQFSSGDVSGSVSNYNRAIQLDPNYASAYNNRGNAKLVLQDYHGANTDIIKAQELFC
jgi:DNA helicase II / ATP-dependent DNA helicase PcrA